MLILLKWFRIVCGWFDALHQYYLVISIVGKMQITYCSCKGKNFIDMDILQTVWVSRMYNSCYGFILKTLNFYLLIYKRLAKEGFLTVFFKDDLSNLTLGPRALVSRSLLQHMLTHFINKILSFDNSFLIHTLTTMKRNNLELEDDCASVRVRSHTAGC